MRLRRANRAEIKHSRVELAGSHRVTTILLWISMAYFILPLWWLFVSSTKTQGDLGLNSGFWFSGFHLWQNLETLFSRADGIFIRWALNSLVYAGFGAAVGTLLSLGAGYAFSKLRFAMREKLFSVILVGVLLPPTVLALPLFLMLSSIHLTNTYWSVLIPGMVSPFGVYLARIFADSSVPDELLEAARIDGVSELRIFFSVAVPLMRPAAVTLFLFQFIGIWNNYLLPLIMLNDEKLYPSTLGLVVWNSQFMQDPTLAQSVLVGSLVLVLPIIVCFLSLQRFLSGGLAMGSVKE